MELSENFSFIFAPRFWAMVIGALSVYLKTKGIIGEPEMVLITTLSVGFIGIRTLDKNVGEAKILAAGVSTGNIETKDVVDVSPVK